MLRFARLFLRGLLYLFGAALVLALAAVLLLDTISKEVLTHRLRAATGMEVKVRSVHVGLLSPTLTIEGFKLYNTADFGGAVCLDVPELHVEYDRPAMRLGNLHLPLLRLNLASLTLVQDKRGRFNFSALKTKDKKSGGRSSADISLKFTGIDTLNLSLGIVRVSNLASGREQEINFALTNQVLHNVKSEADLGSLSMLLAMRGASASGDSDIDLEPLLKALTAP